MWKKLTASIAVLVILLSLGILYRRHEAKMVHLHLEQQAAEAVWNEFLKKYQADVSLGTTRAEVKKYLDDQKNMYVDGREIMVKLGETPDDGLVCDYWNIYASFEFRHAEGGSDPSPQDSLASISLRRVGHCL